MALTNDQITAQNFKDFYSEIRPYLNGQVPTFANTFNKSDLYSTDEQFIGRWIDGKPLYQRVYELSGMTSISNTSWTDTGIAIPSDVDRIIYAHGFASQGRATTDNGTFAMHCHGDSGVNTFRLCVARMTNASIRYFLVQYTKTTDSAVTISDGTEYSTTEQIVGKWIDGRPIYQMTVQGTTPASSGTSVNVGLPTLAQIIDVEGYVVDKDDWTIFVGTQKQEGVINQDFFVCHNVSGDSKIWFGCGSSTVNRPYTLTFRYIKSS